MMMFSQQLTGINAAMFFSTKIFTSAGLTGNAPIYATIAMGALNVIQTVISVYLVDHPKFGRRILHIGGLSGMFVSTLLLTAALSFVVRITFLIDLELTNFESRTKKMRLEPKPLSPQFVHSAPSYS
jgi:SP family facilitated glucose transporter-like MFS transporter 1